MKYILEDEHVLKVVHGCSNDVLWLQRDFSIYMTAAIDTQFMHEILTGVKDVKFNTLAIMLHPDLRDLLEIEETFSDWRLRPGFGLKRQQEIYAVNDVHVLLRVFDELRLKVNLIPSIYKMCQEQASLFSEPDTNSWRMFTVVRTRGHSAIGESI